MFELNGTTVSVRDIAAVSKIQEIPGTRTIYGILILLKTVPRTRIPIWWDRSSGGVSEKSQRDTAYEALVAEWKSATA